MAALTCWLLLAQLGGHCENDVADAISETTFPLITTAVGGLWLAGGEGERITARRSADALLATGTFVSVLKHVTNCERPNDPTATTGFPSAHTAAAFCAATVMAEREPDADPWAYLWAASVGWSRIELDEHNLTQVLAGAAIGNLLGREAATGSGIFGDLIVNQNSNAVATFRPSADNNLLSVRLPLFEASW